VFVRSGVTWSQQAALLGSNFILFANFGSSVAISGDTVVVGALNDGANAGGVADGQHNSSGAAYVFVRSGVIWSQQAYLKASNVGNNSTLSAGDQFGCSVGISGDTLIVGAHFEDSNATGINGDGNDDSAAHSGAAYVFARSGVTWTQQAYLKESNTDAGDQFGTSVAISGDTIIVGANGEASNATGINGNQSDNSAQAAGAA
jgi:hypothetical protein